MIGEIRFFEKANHDKSKAVIEFLAERDGRRIDCIVSYEVLSDFFGADYSDPLPVFETNRSVIEEAAERLILKERFEPDGSIIIRRQDL